jgi:Na+:H+ antiporter, NhaA family
MSNDRPARKVRVLQFLFDNSLFLVGGSLVALIWANVDYDSYHALVDANLLPVGQHKLTLHFLVNDVLMALFFAIAAKEVWESLLPGGALSHPRKAATPLWATAGGVLGPAGLYIAGTLLAGQSGWFGQGGDLGRGWAVPCATDIAFSYLIARLVFGGGHPAIAFLLLLAIADDAAGLIILAVAYPQHALHIPWLALTLGAMAVALVMRRLRLRSSWWYLLVPGVLSWLSFHWTGVHAALGLVPIIPCLPHAHTDLGIYARQELQRPDTLSAFEQAWKRPVEIILGLFGLVNAGVMFGNVGLPTALILLGLLVGKPLGITLFTWLAARIFKLEIPGGMSYRHVFVLGTIAGMGFTVALFMSDAAFPAGRFSAELRDAVKMGALASFFAAVLAFVVARALGIRPQRGFEKKRP